MLLNSVILPTARFENSHGKNRAKFTILDAEESFILHVICINDYKQKLEDLKKKHFTASSTLQPMVIVVGPDIYQLSEFFVYFDGVLYKFKSFLKALDTCFKIFQVFNLKYPLACQNTWLFIQKFFFEIETKFDINSYSVSTLISYLKSQK